MSTYIYIRKTFSPAFLDVTWPLAFTSHHLLGDQVSNLENDKEDKINGGQSLCPPVNIPYDHENISKFMSTDEKQI